MNLLLLEKLKTREEYEEAVKRASLLFEAKPVLEEVEELINLVYLVKEFEKDHHLPSFEERAGDRDDR
jgi:hypothetical protein